MVVRCPVNEKVTFQIICGQSYEIQQSKTQSPYKEHAQLRFGVQKSPVF